MPVMPALIRFFGQTRTQEINASALSRALKELAPGVAFTPGTGIWVLEALFELVLRAHERLAVSA